MAQFLERLFRTWTSSFTPHCLRLLDETLESLPLVPSISVSMPGEVKDPTQGVNV